MGCVQAKGTTYSPNRTIEKLKQQNGYVRGSGGRGGGQMMVGSRLQIKPEDMVKNVMVVSGGKGEEKNKISREGEKGGNGGNVSRSVVVKKIGEELVDGWPKWLVENIHRDVLAGLVPKSADSYHKLAKVGEGTYSNVYKARDRDTGKIVALKKIRFDTSEPESIKFMAREIIILKQLDHPNVIKLEGLATSRMQYSLYLVFDFMQSDLTRIISRPEGRLTEPQVKCYMQQLLSGLQHCHERGILHRDIKASNLLMDENGMLKIADFGLANYYQSKPKRPLTSRVVTLWYRAPELLLGSTDYGVGIDLWSAGCLLAEMFVGRPIMPGRNEIEQLHKIFKLCGSPTEEYWKKVKQPTTFRPTPSHYKPSFQEAFPNLPDSALGLLVTLLSLDPAHRGTAAAALESEFFKTGPLACDLSGLPKIRIKDGEGARSNNQSRNRPSKLKQQSSKIHDGHRRKVSFSEQVKAEFESSKEQEKPAEPSLHSQENMNSSGITASSVKPNMIRERSPPSPPAAFCSRNDRSAKTEARPNALKNIQNYPLLLASLTEAANHLQESRSSLNQRSMSTIDFRKLDLEKISKLFVGLDDN